MKKEEKGMTIDKLATMVARGFEDVSEKVSEVKSDVNELKKSVDHLDRKVDGLELKISAYASSWSNDFDRLHDWVEDLDNRMNKVEDRVAQK